MVDSEFYVPMKEKELAIMMQVEPEDRPVFKKALEELLLENRLQITKRGRYVKPEEKVYTGTFISNGKGFGFVEVEGENEDYYVPETKVHGAFHQDIVEIVLLPGHRGKRQEAEITRVISHGIVQVVGTFEKARILDLSFPITVKLHRIFLFPKNLRSMR